MPRLTAAQRKLRRSTIGSSDIPRLFNGQAMSVWMEKMGLTERTDETFQQDLGHRIEPVVAQLYLDRLKADLAAQGITATITLKANRKTHRHPICRRHTATVDYRALQFEERSGVRLTGEWLVEVKNRNEFARKGWGEEGTDQVPQDILLQCLWQMHVAEFARCDVAVLFGNSSLQVYTIYKTDHMTLLEEAVRRADAMIVALEREEPPEVDGSAAWGEYLATVYPVVKVAEYAEADPETDVLLADLAVAADERKRAEETYERLRTQVKAVVGDRRGLVGAAGRVTWSDVAGKTTTDWKAVLDGVARYVPYEALKDAVGQYTTTGAGYRQFRFTPAKEGK